MVKVTQNSDLLSKTLVLSGERVRSVKFPEELHCHWMTVIRPLHNLRQRARERGKRDTVIATPF